LRAGSSRSIPSRLRIDRAESMPEHQPRLFPWILLGVLSLVYLCASIDRIVISLLVEPIKTDLGLTDTEISLLQGLAFALVFCVASIPMGALVDRTDRTRLLGAGVALWSLMTAWCGLASNFWTLFMARAGLGIGQAALTPAGYSLISDAFEKRRLGLALGIFTTGGAIGTGLSLVLGGYVIGALSRHGDFQLPLLGVLHPWQLTFVLLAIPGLLISIVMAAMPNPLRKTREAVSVDPASVSALSSFYRQNKKLLAGHHLATGLSSLVLLGGYSWIAPLFSRVYGWHPAQVGLAVGIVSIVAAPIGLLGGGVLGDHLVHRGPHMRLWVCAVSVVCGGICGVLYPLMTDPLHATLLFGAMAMFATLPMGVGTAALQHVVPGEVRGRVSAIYFFVTTIIGMVGPILIAVTSDVFFPFPSGIRYATALVVPLGLLVAFVLWISIIPPYRRLAGNPSRMINNPA
jgi:MFS family permease